MMIMRIFCVYLRRIYVNIRIADGVRQSYLIIFQPIPNNVPFTS